MDRRIRALTELTKSKFGLDNYYLKRHELYRDVNMFNETEYTLSMEWFPNHITEHEDGDLNPEGTAVIEMDIHDQRFSSVVFVDGVSYANGIIFSDYDTQDIIKWVEKETGLTYERQFQLDGKKDRTIHFKACLKGVVISPNSTIQLRWNQQGQLILFVVNGHFPLKSLLSEETFTLSLEKVEGIAKEKLIRTDFPFYEAITSLPIYALEETFITNESLSTVPFEMLINEHTYWPLDKTLAWDLPSSTSFMKKDIENSGGIEYVTVEQAYASEPSPDTFPITKDEQESCYATVIDFLRHVYPHDSGKWRMKTLHRANGYIRATLRLNEQDNRSIQRKLVVIIDRHSLQALNCVDNKPMLEMFEPVHVCDIPTIGQEAAYKIIKDTIELTPTYVYDVERGQYVLCGKLHSPCGVDATNGDCTLLKDM